MIPGACFLAVMSSSRSDNVSQFVRPSMRSLNFIVKQYEHLKQNECFNISIVSSVSRLFQECFKSIQIVL